MMARKGRVPHSAAMPVAPIGGVWMVCAGSAAPRRDVEQCWVAPGRVGEVGRLFGSHHFCSGYSYGAVCYGVGAALLPQPVC